MFKRIKILFSQLKANYRISQYAKQNPDEWIKIPRKPLYKIRLYFQAMLWLFGINWHNSIDQECTLDFSCCKDKSHA